MSDFLKRLEGTSPDLSFYGLAPPKRATVPDRLAAIAEAQRQRLEELNPDALVVYDLQDESARQPSARPFPFLPTVSPGVYAHETLAALAIPKIIYRCVAQDSAESLEAWLTSTGASSEGPRATVLVGAPTSQGRSDGLPLREAYRLARRHPEWIVGGIAIAERHARRGDEHERLLQKQAEGCRFFVTQAVYDAGATKSMLSDYAGALRERGERPVPIVFTFSPCGSTKTLELFKWLGIALPRWLENELLDARDILETSLGLCLETWRDVLGFARAKQLPVGLNVESISIRKEEVEASTKLFRALRAVLAAG